MSPAGADVSVDALPAGIRRRLRHTLAQWRHWHCEPPLLSPPGVAQLLTQGHSNISVLVQSRQRRFTLRIDGINPGEFGLNRQAEWRILHDAAAAGLAPAPCYCNAELGSLVCEFLPADDSQAVDSADVAALLRRIHSLPPRHTRLDLPRRIQRYDRLARQRRGAPSAPLEALREPLRRLVQDCADTASERVLCHNDLLRANRLYSGGRLFALDWEYAAMASPWFDLAVVVHGDDMDRHWSRELLEAYLQRPASAEDLRRLHDYGCIYRYLELLWYAALARPLLTPQALEQRCRRLQQMLQITPR